MIDVSNPIIQKLEADGYRITLHAFLRDGEIKTTVAAKHPDTGRLLQGWSKTGDEDEALLDLAKRAALDLS